MYQEQRYYFGKNSRLPQIKVVIIEIKLLITVLILRP